ncbi:MAG: hypothetical protein HXS46_13015 [Theionarchaea archaeon]|nr:hypothetical protein [Theionarchaea archaeon]
MDEISEKRLKICYNIYEQLYENPFVSIADAGNTGISMNIMVSISRRLHNDRQ